jgi:S1-C subfamily serine protease
MLDENNYKDEKGFSFIQEQIASKRKFRFKKMIYSIGWTMVLACVFGIVAGVAFCVSEPAISRFLGKDIEKKTVEFPTITPEDNNTNQNANNQNNNPGSSGIIDVDNKGNDSGTVNPSSSGEDTSKQPSDVTDTNTQPETVIIENTVKADIGDLSNIYLELRNISNEVSKSIVNVTSISSGIDVFKNEYEAIKTTNGIVVFNNGADLLILVSLDKVQGAKDIQVGLTDSVQVNASIQDYDSDLNLAVIAVSLDQISEHNLNIIEPITLGESYSLIVGTPILALGSPNGYTNSMELGMITSKGSSVYITDNKIDTFTTDINYNSNGDGIIVNLKGEVIGLITNKLKDETNQEVNTAIGVSKIKKIIESLVNNTDRVYFGIKSTDMTEDALKSMDLVNGIFVTEVEADSPALESGLQSGDIIVAMNDTPIISVNTFSSLLSVYEPKTTVKITIKRTVKDAIKDMEFEVTLGKKNH